MGMTSGVHGQRACAVRGVQRERQVHWQAPQRAWVSAALRVLVSAALLLCLWLVLPRGRLLAALGSVPWTAWAAAVAVFLMLHLLGAWKWRWTANLAGSDLGRQDAVRCYFAGLFGNTLLPSIVGGDVLRAGLAWRRVRSPAGLVLGSLADRMLDMCALGALAAAGWALAAGVEGTAAQQLLRSLLACAVAGVGVLVAALLLFKPRVLSWRWRRRVVLIRGAGRVLLKQPARLLASFAACLLLQAGLLALSLWLARLCGLRASWQVWLLVWPLGKLAAMVPVTQGGIGVREAALAGLLRPFGVAPALAVASGLVFEGVIVLGSLAGGMIAVCLGRWQARVDAQLGMQTSAPVHDGIWNVSHGG